MKKLLKTVLEAGVLVASVAGLASCGGMDPVTTRFEAEDAHLVSTDTDNSIRGEAKNDENEDVVSGTGSVGYFSTTDESIIWKIESDRDVKDVKAVFSLASASMNIADGCAASRMGDVELSEQYTLKVNDVAVSLEGIIVGPTEDDEADGAKYYLYHTYEVKFDLKKGTNEIVFTKIDGGQIDADEGFSSRMSNGVNVDYLEITAPANLTMEKEVNIEVTEDADDDSTEEAAA